MKTVSKNRARAALVWGRSIALALCLVAAGLLAFATPAWAATSVRIVEGETVFEPTGAETHGSWSWDGNYNLTLDGFTGTEISFEGGDLVITLIGANTLESDGVEGAHGGVFYWPNIVESPTEHSLTFTGPGSLMMDDEISNLGQVTIDGASVIVDYFGRSFAPGAYGVTSSAVFIVNDGSLTIKEGTIKTNTIYVTSSTLDVRCSGELGEAAVCASGTITFVSSRVKVTVDDQSKPSVTAELGEIKLIDETGGKLDGKGSNMIGNVKLVPGGTQPFLDVDPSTPHYDDIIWLYVNGISTGFVQDGKRTFEPYSSVARCDMAAFLYRLAGSPDYTPSAKDKKYFSDVDESTPHAKEIWWLAHQGISEGWEEDDGTHTFRPYASIARCDMAAFLYRLAGSPGLVLTGEDRAYFSDVDMDTPHHNEVWWLASMGVSEGWTEKDGTHTFRPYNQIARADMAAFLHRMDDKGLV